MPVADQQILRGATATLSFQYRDATGEPADPGTVTVGVTRADGTELVAAGTATAGTSASPRTVSLTAAQTAQLDVLAVTWTRTADSTTHSTVAEIVGGYYFDVNAARDSDPILADDVKYTAAEIKDGRAEVENEFEAICEVAFVPRYRRQRVNGTGLDSMLLPFRLPRRVLTVAEVAADASTTQWSAGEVAAIRLADSGVITSPLRLFPCGTRNVIVAWEHGHDRPPNDVRQAALLHLRHRLVRPHTAIPDRATTFQIEGGTIYRLDTAGQRRTGIPDVDAVLDRWTMALPGIG